MSGAQSVEATDPVSGPFFGPATPVSLPHLSVATGHESAVRSPALELQEALGGMLTQTGTRAPRPAAALALAAGVVGVAGVCLAFWVSLARVFISAV